MDGVEGGNHIIWKRNLPRAQGIRVRSYRGRKWFSSAVLVLVQHREIPTIQCAAEDAIVEILRNWSILLTPYVE